MGMLTKSKAVAVVPEPVDDDVARFLQGAKETRAQLQAVTDELDRAKASLAEAKREAAFYKEKLAQSELDRDVWRIQVVTLNTELNGLLQDAENFQQAVANALHRCETHARQYGTQARAEHLDAKTRQEAADLGQKFANNDEVENASKELSATR